MSHNIGNNNININVGSTEGAHQCSPQAQQAQSAMSAMDPLAILGKVAEILKGVLGSISGLTFVGWEQALSDAGVGLMSLEDDRKLLQAVREYLPPDELDPIATIAWDLYEANDNTFPPEAVQRVREILDGYRADLKALGEAIFGLARFVIYVTESLGDKVTGEKAADLMREYGRLYEPFWEQVGAAASNVGGEAAETFQSFAGADASRKTAPVFGQAAPVGTVPLRNLAPPTRPPPQPSRPPPWAKKK